MQRVFSAAAISNAIVLASFQAKGFPQPSTNRIVIWDYYHEGEPEPRYFEISPDLGQMSYTMGDQAPDSLEIFTNETAVQRAWDFLPRLGMNQSEFIKTNTGVDGVWGVFLPRQIDGVQIFEDLEGFSFQQFVDQTKMRGFSIVMPKLERYRSEATASDQQIIACIRASKTPIIANDDELNYLDRVKSLAKTKKFIITNFTPYYSEGVYGGTNYERTDLVTPLAKLDAIADFGNSNTVVHMYSPVSSSDVKRLLGK